MQASEIAEISESILAGSPISSKTAFSLTQIETDNIPLLAAYAHKIRLKFAGNTVEMCGIINARSGACSEDCKFCGQSTHHQTTVAVYPLLPPDELVVTAKKAAASGVKRLSLVTSGKGMTKDNDFEKILASIVSIKRETGLKVCANLGTISPAQALALAAAGVERYAHNLETSEQFYPNICTTHSYQDRIQTVQAAQSAGLELCSGGIIGLGESWQDRLQLAFALREIGAASIPVNILNPIKGTPLESAEPLAPLEIIKTFAIFRFILPDKIIRPAGGREINLRDWQSYVLLSGANGLIVGNYLTFNGRNTAADYQMVKDGGFEAI